MNFDYLISSFLATLIVDHHEKEKQNRLVKEDPCDEFHAIDPSVLKKTTTLSSNSGAIDLSWRENYRDNVAKIDPDNYDTLEEFLPVHDAIVDAMRKEYTKAILNQLSELTGKYNLRMAAAIVYCGFKSRLDKKDFTCAEECLSEIVTRNGISLATIISISEQLEDAIRFYQEHPDTTQEFNISLL